MYPTKSDTILNNLIFLSIRVKRFDLSPAVLSVIAAEMFFRGSLHRMVEYCTWVALWFINAKRVETLSVGIAQIQLKRWVELGYICSLAPTISNLKAVFSVDNNYAACHRYLAHLSFSELSDPKQLSKVYSGRARIFHVNVIDSALSAAGKIPLTKASSRRAKGARG